MADIAWNSDGNLFAVADTDGKVYIYDENGKEMTTFIAPRLSTLDWNPLTNQLATVNDVDMSIIAFSRRQITIWTSNGEIAGTVKGLHNVVSAEYSPDGQILASVEWDLKGALWDAQTYRAIYSVSLGSYARTLSDSHFAQSIAWSPDSTRIAFLSNNNTQGIFSFVIWDVATKQIVEEVMGPGHFFTLWTGIRKKISWQLAGVTVHYVSGI